MLVAFGFLSSLQTYGIRIYIPHVITCIPPSFYDVTACILKLRDEEKQNCIFFFNSFDLGIPVQDQHQNAGECRHSYSTILQQFAS